MTFTLKPDDNGIIVVLSDVDEKDEKKLEEANAKAFDPTDEPFNKYYAYDKNIGFHVGKDHFDHAEHKGKRLSFEEYMKLISNGEIIEAEDAMKAVDCIHKLKDAEYDLDFIIKRILEINEPKTVANANAALATLNFAIFKMLDVIDYATEESKKDLHKAIDHAFDIYSKAESILSGSNFDMLADLAEQLKKYRNISGQAQGLLLQKFKENF